MASDLDRALVADVDHDDLLAATSPLGTHPHALPEQLVRTEYWPPS